MLQCHLCNKPFTNTSSHTRHVRYCLRTRNKPRVRQKSCQACSASKVKCTFQRPSCARCHKKGVECVYDEEQLSNQPAAPEESDVQDVVPGPDQVNLYPWPLDLTSRVQAGPIDWTTMDLFLPPEFSTPNITGFNTQPIQAPLSFHDSSVENQSLLPNFLANPTPADHELLTETASLSTISNRIALPDGSTTQHGPSTSSHNLTVSPYLSLPTGIAHPTILTFLSTHAPTPCFNSAIQFSLTTIIRGLRSYPLMMLQKETFPPLIHAHLLDMHASPLSNNSHQTEALADPSSSSSSQTPTPSSIISKCMSIAHLYARRTPETAPYLWDAILEQTNLFSSHLHTLSSAALISAIQAQLIYIIMRIAAYSPQSHQPAPSSPNLNLSYSIMYVFKHLCEMYVLKYGTEERYYHAYMAPATPPAPGFVRDKKSEWEDFIIVESWRRMKVIFWLISKIVDVNMGATVCCTSRYEDVEWIMLPCGRGEWDARDELEWERMRTVSLTGPGAAVGRDGKKKKLDTVGSLLEAHRGTMGFGGFGGGNEVGGASTSCSEALDHWNAEADRLGALLNASLGMV